MQSMVLGLLGGLVLTGLVACGDDDTTEDAGRPADGGTSPTDAGRTDTGAPDMGTTDTGSMASLTRIVVEPATVRLEVGGTQALSVTGTFDDGSTAPVTMGITWRSDNTGVAIVGPTGTVTGGAVGQATITAAVGALMATAAVTVEVPAVERVVFADEFGEDVTFNAFAPTTFAVDTTQQRTGTASLRFDVPTAPPSGFVGGALSLMNAGDLSRFQALTFYARASSAQTIDVFGIGNDATNTDFQVEVGPIDLTTQWQRFVIPIPAPALLTMQSGLFHFAEGPAMGGDFSIFFDDVKYEGTVPGLGMAAPAMASTPLNLTTGATARVGGTVITYTVDGAPRTYRVSPRYFGYVSSDPLVATVDATGQITAVGVGMATITGTFQRMPVAGSIQVTVAAPTIPQTPAPTPTHPAADVIALFSNPYTNAPVSSFDPPWDACNVTDVRVGTDDVKQFSYTGAGNFAGIEFVGANSLNLTNYSRIRIDLWSPDATQFRVNLVDFGADNAFGGGDDSNSELTFDATTTPALATSTWVTFDLPLSSFTGLRSLEHVSQLIVSVDNAAPRIVFYDNILFRR